MGTREDQLQSTLRHGLAFSVPGWPGVGTGAGGGGTRTDRVSQTVTVASPARCRGGLNGTHTAVYLTSREPERDPVVSIYRNKF